MPDNRKYDYLKRKEHYFDDDSIVLLDSGTYYMSNIKILIGCSSDEAERSATQNRDYSIEGEGIS